MGQQFYINFISKDIEMSEEQFKKAQMIIKQRIHASPLYAQVLSQSKTFIETLSSQQAKQIGRGRSSQLFKSLQLCRSNSFMSVDRCISNILQSNCEEKFRNMSRCLIVNSRDPKSCSDGVDGYVECLRNVTKKFYLSTVLSF